jgi:transcription elongation factor Elf1
VAKPDVARFDCPNCAAKYKLVRAEADAKTLDRQITCRSCGVPFHGLEGSMVLKYFLVDRPKRQASAARFG